MSQRFAEKYPEVRMVADPRDMIGQIDGVYIDDINAISLYPLLARPFLEAGIPTFVKSALCHFYDQGTGDGGNG